MIGSNDRSNADFCQLKSAAHRVCCLFNGWKWIKRSTFSALSVVAFQKGINKLNAVLNCSEECAALPARKTSPAIDKRNSVFPHTYFTWADLPGIFAINFSIFCFYFLMYSSE